MIVDQYKPQVPDTSNELHSLTLMRMQARKDADAAYKRLNTRVQSFFKPQRTQGGILGVLLSNISVVMTGISFGKKLMESFRSRR